MKVQVKVTKGKKTVIVEVETDTIPKCRRIAIEKAGFNGTTEIISGIPTCVVAFMIKPITKRRLPVSTLDKFAELSGAKRMSNEWGKSFYHWSEKNIELLKKIPELLEE